MIMKNLLPIFITLCLFSSQFSSAQNKHFITTGTIEYERTMNMFALIKKKVTKNTMDVQPFLETYLRTEPQFIKLKSQLSFGPQVSVFSPSVREYKLFHRYDSPMANQLNTVHTDFKTGRSTIQKDFFERTFLVKDSIRKIRWKLSDETRMIAGYQCRRANGIMLDSIYVVAFYTDEIHVSGGPESFNGLPGMILGVALPHENVTWFATKINPGVVDPKTLIPPKKGEEVDNKKMKEEILKVVAPTGDYAIVQLKGLMI